VAFLITEGLLLSLSLSLNFLFSRFIRNLNDLTSSASYSSKETRAIETETMNHSYREGYVGSGRRVSVHMELTAVASNP
jgi:hypothetical protein